MKTALISVFDKEHIIDFAESLMSIGWNIMASGGTAKEIANAGIPVTNVATIVGDPILGHRVVTLSREVHAALLARDTPEDNAELQQIGVPRIDLVCVDLYPLERAIKQGHEKNAVIEMIDIGGPTMLMSGAKGRRIVVCSPNDRDPVIKWLRNDQPKKEEVLDYLAAKAFAIVAMYRLVAAKFFNPSVNGYVETVDMFSPF